MKHFLILFCLLIFSWDFASAKSYLSNMSKSEDKDSVQVFLSFDTLPRHESKIVGKRLNIVLRDTVIDQKTTFFEENEKIVKILTRPHKNSTIISFFFRYAPQKVTIVPNKNKNLVADILLGNRFSKTYQDLSSRLQGVTLLDRQTKDFANPLIASPYAHDWKSFFSHYESPVSITSPVKIYLPSFPIIRLLPPGKNDNINLIPDEALLNCKQKSWNKAASILQKRISSITNIEAQKIIALTYGEILMRAGNFEGAYKQFYLLKDKYPDEQVGLFSAYMLGILVATHDDPYSADYEFRGLNDKLNHDNPLLPYLQLSLSETSLATKQLDQLKNSLSRDDLAYPKEIEFRRELRQADYLYATGKPIKAYVAYQLVLGQNNIYDQPYSLNGYCNTLYNQSSFTESSECYDRLALQIIDRNELGKVYYRAAMSRIKYSDNYSGLINEFSKIEDTFPNTEAGFRAALKKTDIQYLNRLEWTDTAVKYYRALADRSIYRPVSEEAFFKEALLFHLMGDDSTSIKLTMTLLRNFRSGNIRASAEALLIQLLPGELKRLIQEENYTSALALARQNRRLFDNNWIDVRILSDLAYSYNKLGIYNDALRLYHYLIQIAGIEEKEEYFIPLTEIAFAKGDYNLVEDYTTQYSYYYPKGKFLNDIRYLRINALFTSDQIDKAITLLPEPLPDSEKYILLAADLHFSVDNYFSVVELLAPLFRKNNFLPGHFTFLLAESLFHTNNFEQAEPLFNLCREKNLYPGQSTYRLAQISRNDGDEKKALSLFSDIISGSDDTLWKKYAEKELEINKLNNNL